MLSALQDCVATTKHLFWMLAQRGMLFVQLMALASIKSSLKSATSLQDSKVPWRFNGDTEPGKGGIFLAQVQVFWLVSDMNSAPATGSNLHSLVSILSESPKGT